jgi:RNA polymerase sigma-70 factor (sigma-E family)
MRYNRNQLAKNADAGTRTRPLLEPGEFNAVQPQPTRQEPETRKEVCRRVNQPGPPPVSHDVTGGFEEAFDELYGRAFGLARRLLGDAAAAEDVAAEALARAYSHWTRLEGLPHRDGWVLRVTANLAIDHLRRKSPAITPQQASGAEDAVALRLALAAALALLPRRQRQAVSLRYLGDLSDSSVASALGISPGSVKTHVHRGLAALRATMGRDLEELVLHVHE